MAFGWHVLEPPSRRLVKSRALDAVCEHLEAVSAGQIKRLVINVPPGFSKSLGANVFWPAWEWGPRRTPWIRTVSASYAERLSVRDNRKFRQLVTSDLYRRAFPEVSIAEDENNKRKIENTKTGWKFATSVGGVGTGERGDRFVIDDPHNVLEGESDLRIEEARLWFSEVVTTRQNDDKSAIVLIMQRVSDRDLTSVALAQEQGYQHLMLPMEFVPERRCSTSIGFTDWRTEKDELLEPIRYPRDRVEANKRAMGPYASSAQFQQDPVPRGGGMFKEEDLRYVDAAPLGGRTVRGWDLAASLSKDAAYTAGVLIREVNGAIYIEDVARFRAEPSSVYSRVEALAARDGHSTLTSLPQDPGQAGLAQVAEFARRLHGRNFRCSPESGSKEQRATPLAAQHAAHNVYLVRGPWNRDFVAELTRFPNGATKDQVDAASRAYAELLRTPPAAVPGGPVNLS